MLIQQFSNFVAQILLVNIICFKVHINLLELVHGEYLLERVYDASTLALCYVRLLCVVTMVATLE